MTSVTLLSRTFRGDHSGCLKGLKKFSAPAVRCQGLGPVRRVRSAGSVLQRGSRPRYSSALRQRKADDPAVAPALAALRNVGLQQDSRFISFCAELFPLWIMSSSRLRPSWLNRTTYFFTAISLADMVAPIAVPCDKGNQPILSNPLKRATRFWDGGNGG